MKAAPTRYNLCIFSSAISVRVTTSRKIYKNIGITSSFIMIIRWWWAFCEGGGGKKVGINYGNRKVTVGARIKS